MLLHRVLGTCLDELLFTETIALVQAFTDSAPVWQYQFRGWRGTDGVVVSRGIFQQVNIYPIDEVWDKGKVVILGPQPSQYCPRVVVSCVWGLSLGSWVDIKWMETILHGRVEKCFLINFNVSSLPTSTLIGAAFSSLSLKSS